MYASIHNIMQQREIVDSIDTVQFGRVLRAESSSTEARPVFTPPPQADMMSLGNSFCRHSGCDMSRHLCDTRRQSCSPSLLVNGFPDSSAFSDIARRATTTFVVQIDVVCGFTATPPLSPCMQFCLLGVTSSFPTLIGSSHTFSCPFLFYILCIITLLLPCCSAS